MKSLMEACRAYCAQKEQIAALSREMSALGSCGEGGDGPSCLDEFANTSEGRPFYEARPDESSEFCDVCQERMRLASARYRERSRLGGLMRTMLRAYRAEIGGAR